MNGKLGRGGARGPERPGGSGEETRGGGPGTQGPAEAGDARFICPAAAGGGTAGGERRRLRFATPLRRRQQTAARPLSPAALAAASAGVQDAKPPRSGSGRPRSAGRDHLLLLLLRAAASGACAGLAWAPGPRPARAARGDLRGPWGPRSWALAGVQPPPHAAPGTGAPRRPRKPSAGEGGVPNGDERAPAPATASCPPGRKGGNRSSITAAPARPADTRREAARRLALRAQPRSPKRRRPGAVGAASGSWRGRA